MIVRYSHVSFESFFFFFKIITKHYFFFVSQQVKTFLSQLFSTVNIW